ncbi:polyprenyl synthetase family protein [Egicoccus halophilus]|uniref:Geranylgeranyl pyrophosphate synthase n=1 Tax=Egicoccus halophilus TaxID=1670830 RepID=A0A8J3A7M3_9ACTN|nr:polyprenyl synthetase family protein [Egicoccus halophilus]GGI02959.1 geranylgeranyl pyrophosphate synthase [Egicoccus halophilus]
MTVAPSALSRLRDEVDRALEVALDRRLPRLAGHHPALSPVADQLCAFVAGGKRIRPVLLLLGHAAADGDPDDVMGPALALELLHTFALAHDDVIDRADTRRGAPSVHRVFEAGHREAGWDGDAAAYGEAVAILLGDLAFVFADELFLTAAVSPVRLLSGLSHFTRLREEVMAGQYLDLWAATSRTTDRALSERIAAMKSGWYSVARPLEVGALLAGGDPELVAGLGRFGDPLGRAFQVRDDLLGMFGEEDETGKSTWGDLAEGKRTLLIAEAAERLAPADWKRLEATLGAPELDAGQAALARELLVDCGARDAAEAYVAEEVDTALAVLDTLSLPREVGEALRDLAGYLGTRSS